MAEIFGEYWWQLTDGELKSSGRPIGTPATVFTTLNPAQLVPAAWQLHCERLGAAPPQLRHWDRALDILHSLRTNHPPTAARIVHDPDTRQVWFSLRTMDFTPTRIVLKPSLGLWPDYHTKWWQRDTYRRNRPQYRDNVRYERLLVDGRCNRVWETDSANILMEKDGLWHTPDAALSPLLVGTTLRDLMQRRSILARPLTLDELRSADQIWICNALIGLQPAELEA